MEGRDEMDNEDTYVTAIPDKANREKYEISEEDAEKVIHEAQTENEDIEQEYVDNISNKENDSSRMNDDVDLGQIGIEEGHGYLGQLKTDEDNSGTHQRINSEPTKDELDVKYESGEIYENFSVCLSECQDNLSANSSRVTGKTILLLGEEQFLANLEKT